MIPENSTAASTAKLTLLNNVFGLIFASIGIYSIYEIIVTQSVFTYIVIIPLLTAPQVQGSLAASIFYFAVFYKTRKWNESLILLLLFDGIFEIPYTIYHFQDVIQNSLWQQVFIITSLSVSLLFLYKWHFSINPKLVIPMSFYMIFLAYSVSDPYAVGNVTEIPYLVALSLLLYFGIQLPHAVARESSNLHADNETPFSQSSIRFFRSFKARDLH